MPKKLPIKGPLHKIISVEDPDSDPVGSGSGIIVPNPDMTFLTKNLVKYLQIFLEMVKFSLDYRTHGTGPYLFFLIIPDPQH
jgi:hypothetical protein